jgi:hypothetical protein
LSNQAVVTKYLECAKISNLTLKACVDKVLPGASILELCVFGETVMTAGLSRVYDNKVNGKKVDKGIAFPICFSVNDIICNYSPLRSEETVSLGGDEKKRREQQQREQTNNEKHTRNTTHTQNTPSVFHADQDAHRPPPFAYQVATASVLCSLGPSRVLEGR